MIESTLTVFVIFKKKEYINLKIYIFNYRYAFSKNGRPTIESKANPSEILGQSRVTGGLTDSDAAQLNNMYCKGEGTCHTYRNQL